MPGGGNQKKWTGAEQRDVRRAARKLPQGMAGSLRRTAWGASRGRVKAEPFRRPAARTMRAQSLRRPAAAKKPL